MMTAEGFAWLFLNHVPFLGPLRFQRLLNAAGSAEAILAMSIQELQAAEVGEALASAWYCAFRDPDLRCKAESEQRQAEQGLFRIVAEPDPDYPAILRELSGRPPVLYVQGIWPLPEGLTLGIVGTRRSSPYGEAVAERLTRELARRKIVVVSGLAAGIDAIAHRTALKMAGPTAAVLGHGLGHQYPRENAGLFKAMAEKGTLITEYPYHSPPETGHFPRRNRIISGLSQGVLVIEAAERSGALITARYAAEQGRDVFAVPGNVLQGSHTGCHRLLKQGAKLVETVEDILEEYDASVRRESNPSAEASRPIQADLSDLSPMERRVLTHCSNEPISVDVLTEQLACPFDQLARSLLSLELKGHLRQIPGQRYVAIIR